LRMEHGWVHLPADEISGPVVAVGKLLLNHLPGNDRERRRLIADRQASMKSVFA
jgi:hypothetical protein